MLKTYEAMFIFPASLNDEGIEAAIDRIKGELENKGGSVTKVENMGRRAFARPMDKKNSGIYVRLTCELVPSSVDALLARFKLNEDIFRVQIILEPRLPEVPVKDEESNVESE
jgi:small subunit ribosomal protein S6